MRIIILGLGRSLRGDDSAGLEAVRLWEATHPKTASHPDVHVEYAEVPGITLLSLLEGMNTAILVDAVQSGAPPGTIHKLDGNNLPALLNRVESVHGLGVIEALALGRLTAFDQLPKTIVIIGIEIQQTDLGARLSPEVHASLEKAAQEIEKIVQGMFIKN